MSRESPLHKRNDVAAYALWRDLYEQLAPAFGLPRPTLDQLRYAYWYYKLPVQPTVLLLGQVQTTKTVQLETLGVPFAHSKRAQNWLQGMDADNVLAWNFVPTPVATSDGINAPWDATPAEQRALARAAGSAALTRLLDCYESIEVMLVCGSLFEKTAVRAARASGTDPHVARVPHPSGKNRWLNGRTWEREASQGLLAALADVEKEKQTAERAAKRSSWSHQPYRRKKT